MEEDLSAFSPPTTRLITSHGAVLLFLAAHPGGTVAEMAASLGITERRITSVLRDLQRSGMLSSRPSGRRRVHAVNVLKIMRYPVGSGMPIAKFLRMGRLSTERITSRPTPQSGE